MIQDRLTAKFQSAKPTQRRETKPQATTVAAKPAKKPVADRYTQGRTLSGSFWI